MAEALVSLDDVTRTFREGERVRTVLDRLTLEVQRGECVALLGRSGSGKSTLLNLIGGIDRPDAGRVRVDGRDLTRADERTRTLFRRAHIGFVYQFFNLIPTLTVEENLLLPLELNGLRQAPALERALELLEAVGLPDRRQSFPDRLSGGEQQRVAIARALVHEPSLVLADEPTGNLDAETGTQVVELIERLVGRAGHTLIVVTHDPAVARLADRVLTLESGRLVPHAESPA